MPVQYGGVISEAKSVRESVGIFDVSHMARIRLTGPDVFSALQLLTTNDLANLSDGGGQYSLFTNLNGGCVDDLIAFRISAQEYYLVVNASNHKKDVEWMQSHFSGGVSLMDETKGSALIAVQGPEAAALLDRVSDTQVSQTSSFSAVNFMVRGVPAFATRTGYTGEDGFEITVAAPHAAAVWDTLMREGAAPCGLAARDALRVEAGLPLYGHELSEELSPVAAGIGWAISKTKEFLGSDAIAKVRLEKPEKRLVGVQLATKRLLMPGMSIVVEGAIVGEVTSGVYSVVHECGIGLAFVNKEVALGTLASVDLRGRLEPCSLVAKRFIAKKN